MDEGLLQCHHGSWTQQFPARNYQYCEGHHKSLCISRVKENNFFKLISHHLSNIFLKIVSNKTFLKFDIIYINLHTELNGLIFFSYSGFYHDCEIQSIQSTSSPSSIMILRSLLIFFSMLLSSIKDPNASSVNSAFRHCETFCPGSHMPYKTIKDKQI